MLQMHSAETVEGNSHHCDPSSFPRKRRPCRKIGSGVRLPVKPCLLPFLALCLCRSVTSQVLHASVSPYENGGICNIHEDWVQSQCLAQSLLSV
jgi:hypothetical protein